MRFAIYLSGGFTTMVHSNKSTGKETGKTHLCALCWDGDQFVLRDYPKSFPLSKFAVQFAVQIQNSFDICQIYKEKHHLKNAN